MNCGTLSHSPRSIYVSMSTFGPTNFANTFDAYALIFATALAVAQLCATLVLTIWVVYSCPKSLAPQIVKAPPCQLPLRLKTIRTH